MFRYDKLQSKNTVKHLNSIISIELLNILNKKYNIILYHLNILEDKFRNYSWFYNKNTLKLYHINIILDDIKLNGTKSNKKILKFLGLNRYYQININISEIKRNEIFNNINTINISFNNNRIHYIINNFNKIEIIENQLKKRKRSEFIKPKKKKRKMEDWISASKVRNYLLNDPLIDWLKEYNINNIYDIPFGKKPCTTNKINDEFTKYIMEQGIKFENKLYLSYLKPKFKTNIIKIAETVIHILDDNKFKKTVEHMENGTPIIYQGVLHDRKNKLYGCPDLIIRSDFLKKIFPKIKLYTPLEEKKGSYFNKNYHYVIVDIKHSTLNFNIDKKTLRNCGSIPVYKGQLRIYNKILETIQGYLPDYCFILGKKKSY